MAPLEPRPPLFPCAKFPPWVTMTSPSGDAPARARVPCGAEKGRQGRPPGAVEPTARPTAGALEGEDTDGSPGLFGASPRQALGGLQLAHLALNALVAHLRGGASHHGHLLQRKATIQNISLMRCTTHYVYYTMNLFKIFFFYAINNIFSNINFSKYLESIWILFGFYWRAALSLQRLDLQLHAIPLLL